MRAIIWSHYGSPEVLKLQEVDKPSPQDDEILIRLEAVNITAGDCEMRQLDFPWIFKLAIRLYTGIRSPKRIKILGQEYAGQIEAIGSQVTNFHVGDKVFGATSFQMGAYAEYLCVKAQGLDGVVAPMPNNQDFIHSAVIPVGGLNALHFLHHANIHPGQQILINGAGGSIGTLALQMAKKAGGEVSVVDHVNKATMLKKLGADFFYDYNTTDFSTLTKRFDVVFNVVKQGYVKCIRALKADGILINGNPTLLKNVVGKMISLFRKKRIINGTADYNDADLIKLKNLSEKGDLKPVVDQIFPMSNIVAAHRYVESGKKLGNVVLKIR